MKFPRTFVVACLDGDRLCALSAAVRGSGARVRAWVTAQAPAGAESAAIGAWARETLDQAGVSGGRVMLAVPRGEVVLKRMRLPRGVGEGDLASMVRLQMTRQLTVSPEGAAIDYVPIDERPAGSGVNGEEQFFIATAGAAPATNGPGNGNGANGHTNGNGSNGHGAHGSGGTAEAAPPPSVDLLAAALPGDRMAFLRSATEASGLKIERIGLRCAGAAALLARGSRARRGTVLGVAAGPASIEFLIVERGRLVFARAADFGLATGGGPELAQRVAVEAKRTWMSYRAGQDSAAVDSAAVVGEGRLASELALRCGQELEVGCECVGIPEEIELPDSMGETDRLTAAPLVGLLAEHLFDIPTIDFADPRRAPDLSAARRQRVLAAVLGLVVVGGGAFVWGLRDLSGLRIAGADAEDRRSDLQKEYDAFLLTEARLRHIEQWMAGGVDWLSHVRYLSETMPDPRQAQLDQISGLLDPRVRFSPKEGRYSGGSWGVDRGASLTLQGRASGRSVADGLRSVLASDRAYTLDSPGADTPDRFRFVLNTGLVDPSAPPPSRSLSSGRADR